MLILIVDLTDVFHSHICKQYPVGTQINRVICTLKSSHRTKLNVGQRLVTLSNTFHERCQY